MRKYENLCGVYISLKANLVDIFSTFLCDCENTISISVIKKVLILSLFFSLFFAHTPILRHLLNLNF